MKKELDKINCYFEEAYKRYKSDSTYIPDCRFYELWENIQQPLPFIFDNEEITLAGQTFKLVNESTVKKACFEWNKQEECVSLVIEGNEWIDRIFIHLEDGDPLLIQHEPQYLEDLGLSYGEKLEVVFDVIADLRKNSPGTDIFNLKKNDFLKALENLNEHYEKNIISLMKRLSLSSIRRLVKKASEDIPRDELTNQLHLPLDGNYAGERIEECSEDGETENHVSKFGNSTFPREYKIAGRTTWSAVRDIELLCKAAEFAADAEDIFIITFAEAELLEINENNYTYKVGISDNIHLEEGDILEIFIRGGKGGDSKLGTFRIDLYDVDVIYGRIRFYDIPQDEEICRKLLYARSVNSSVNFLKTGMESMLDMFREGTVPQLVKYITGVDDVVFREQKSTLPDSELDDIQQRAMMCAVDGENKIVLVQGPPGTGKTKVFTEILNSLCKMGKRVLVTAPSHTAVDNICRRVDDEIPMLRFGRNVRKIAPDVAGKFWIGERVNITRFVDKRKENRGGGIYAGTHLGLLKEDIIRDDIAKNGLFDVVIFDEAGMAAVPEFLMLSALSERVVLFGDHKQLPPFPLPPYILERLDKEYAPRLSSVSNVINVSALEWLQKIRNFPVILLRHSYRCQNPRLIRFSSTLFYDALVTASDKAEYFSLPYNERIKKYPPDSLKLISTSELPAEIKGESIILEGGKPGIENRCEALTAVNVIYRLLCKYPLKEITLIAPYKRHVKLIRKLLSKEKTEEVTGRKLSDRQWQNFLFTRIATVDSFQGGESDAVIISYVRSNEINGIGFIDNANRINVAHTRCRKEMIVIGDIECLKKYAKNEIFRRMERSILRDGEIHSLTPDEFELIRDDVPIIDTDHREIDTKLITVPASEKKTEPAHKKKDNPPLSLKKKSVEKEVQSIRKTSVDTNAEFMVQPDLF